MTLDPSGARFLRGGEATGELADLAWALDTDDATAIRTFPLEMGPGTVVDRHAHTAPLAARITTGRLAIDLGAGSVLLEAGDVVGLPTGLPHVESVPEDVPVELLVAHVAPFDTYTL